MRNGMPQRREWESGAGLEFIQFGPAHYQQLRSVTHLQCPPEKNLLRDPLLVEVGQCTTNELERLIWYLFPQVTEMHGQF